MGNIFEQEKCYCAIEQDQKTKFSQTKIKSSCASAKKYTQYRSDLLNQYHIDTQNHIGKGAFGTIYKATSKFDANRQFAIKTIDKRKLTQQELSDTYQEVKMLIQLDHPNIPKFYEIYEEGKYIYMVMELLNSDLGSIQKSLAKEQARMTEKQIANMVKQILLALNYMHSNNILHRDIKLENIMTDQSRKNWYLVDFGLAEQTKNKLSTLVGTGYYISPEVIKHSYGEESDLWSLGVVIYFLLTGSFPFNGKSLGCLFQSTKRGVYRKLPDSVSIECRNFVDSLLTVSKKDRLTAAQALQHKWIIKNTENLSDQPKNTSQTKSPSIQPHHHQNLQSFHAQSLLKKEVYKSCINYFLKNDLMELDQAFFDLDVNQIGMIECKNIKAAISQSSTKDDTRVKQVLNELANYEFNHHKISYSDFILALVSQQQIHQIITPDKVKAIFKSFDINRDGMICKEDLNKAFNKLGRQITKDEINLIFDQHDSDYSQKLSLNDFQLIINPENDAKQDDPVQQAQRMDYLSIFENDVNDVKSTTASNNGMSPNNTVVVTGNNMLTISIGSEIAI